MAEKLLKTVTLGNFCLMPDVRYVCGYTLRQPSHLPRAASASLSHGSQGYWRST